MLNVSNQIIKSEAIKCREKEWKIVECQKEQKNEI